MKKHIMTLTVAAILAACGGVYHVDPIIKTDENHALTWNSCSWRTFALNCNEETGREYINPYTYNPIEAPGKDRELPDGRPSLYKIASTIYSQSQFSEHDLVDAKGLAISLRDNNRRGTSAFLFTQISSSSTPHSLQTFTDKDNPDKRQIADMLNVINQQLTTFSLYSTAGFKRQPVSAHLQALYASLPKLRGDTLVQFNKQVIEEAFPNFIKKDTISSLEQARLARNMLQQAILRVSDKTVAKHLAAIKATQVNANLLLGLSAAGLTSYSTIASEVMAKTTSAAASGTIAARSMFNEQVYRDMLIETVIGSVISERVLFRQALESKLISDVLAYSAEAAINDAIQYHEMGSFYYGLQKVREDAEAANKKRLENINGLREQEAKEQYLSKKDKVLDLELSVSDKERKLKK